MNLSMRPPTPGPRNWSQSLEGPVLEALRRSDVTTEAVDADTLRFLAVPMAVRFNKERANLLLRRLSPRAGAVAYIDADLAYEGDDPAIAAIFTGTSARNWRELKTVVAPGSAGESLSRLLTAIGSPLATDLEAAVARSVQRSPASGARTGGMLAFAGELLTPETAKRHYESCFRKSLARDLAVLTTRPTHPRSAILWGDAGAGVNHLLLAAAWPLLENERVKRVYRVSAAMVGAGCIFPPERDAGLMSLLRDALVEDDCLLLIEDLDVCLTGSPISFSLLNGALDRGLRFLATFKAVDALRELRREEEATARRLAAICVASPTNAEIVKAVEHLAVESGLNVSPAAVQAAAGLTDRKDALQPAAALAQLGAVIAEARWQGRSEVGPDDVLAIFDNQWPE